MTAYISRGSSAMDTSRDTSSASVVHVQGSGGSPTGPNTQVELIPHRIFVGGFPSATVEQDLRLFFETYGRIREVKIIRSPDGSPKGYGFITFETEEEAQAVRKQCEDGMEFNGRRLNVGPAMRRITPTTRFSDLAVAAPTVMMQSAPYANGGAFVVPEGYLYASGQQGATYAVMVPNQAGAYTPQVAYASPFSYGSLSQIHQQPRYILPAVANQALNTSAAPLYGTNANAPTDKTVGNHVMSPRGGGGQEGGRHPSPRSAPATHYANTAYTPHPPPAHTAATPYSFGYSHQPLTPMTPGYNQHSAGFQWPSSQVQNVQYSGTPAVYGQTGEGVYGTGVEGGQTGGYQMADMTHYSQMYPPVHQDYPDIYATPATDTKYGYMGMGMNESGVDVIPAFHYAAGMLEEDGGEGEEGSLETEYALPPPADTRGRPRESSSVHFPTDPVTPEKRAGLRYLNDSSTSSTLSPSPRLGRGGHHRPHRGAGRDAPQIASTVSRKHSFLGVFHDANASDLDNSLRS